MRAVTGTGRHVCTLDEECLACWDDRDAVRDEVSAAFRSVEACRALLRECRDDPWRERAVRWVLGEMLDDFGVHDGVLPWS